MPTARSNALLCSTEAAQWAARALSLLGALRGLEGPGTLEGSSEDAGQIQDALSAHIKAALEMTAEGYDAAARTALSTLLEHQDVDGSTRLGELLHQEAVHGWWQQSVPVAQNLCGALAGQSVLFGLGVVIQRTSDDLLPRLSSEVHVEHLKSLLLADHQVANAFRVILLPVLLGTPQTAALDAWEIAALRTKLENWAEFHAQGHPGVDEALGWLKELNIEDGPAKYADLMGRATEPGPDRALMDAYSLVGLVLHSPEDAVTAEPLFDTAGALSSMVFPRSQCEQVLDYLEQEHEAIFEALGCGGLAEGEAEDLRAAQVRCEADLRDLQSRYKAILLDSSDKQEAPSEAAGAFVRDLLLEALGADRVSFLAVVSSANGYYEALKPTREALRYLRLRSMLNHAGGRVGLPDSAGLLALLHLEDEQHQVVLHAHHAESGSYAGLGVWPLLPWESAQEFLTGLEEALEAAGVSRMAAAPSSSGAVH